MPIHINLLAEQQAEEEARRKDPVKYAFWGGGFLIGLVLLWSLALYFQSSAARGELERHETRWKQIETDFLQVSNNYKLAGVLQKRLDSLHKYSTNRFLWASALNTFQHLPLNNVRVISILGQNEMSEAKQETYTTNDIIGNIPQKSWWQFSAPPMETNVVDVGKRMLGLITNRAELVKYQDHLRASIVASTSLIQVVVRPVVIRPETVTERISLSVSARDYNDPPGRDIDRFYASVTNAPFFRPFLSRTNSSVQPESVLPRDDITDLVNPGALFMPFVMEARLPERIRSNE